MKEIKAGRRSDAPSKPRRRPEGRAAFSFSSTEYRCRFRDVRYGNGSPRSGRSAVAERFRRKGIENTMDRYLII